MTTFEHIEYVTEKSIAFVKFNRPSRLNAMSIKMSSEIADAVKKADEDETIRVIILTGNGSAFCAGTDLSQVSGGGSEGTKVGGNVAFGIFSCRKPIICAINGSAVGIGITLTLPADIRVVAEDAKIGFVFSTRGIVPEACSTYLLPKLVGPGKASELLFTGRVFLAKDESQSGLFNYVVPRDQVLSKAIAIAREISENTSSVSVVLTKALLQTGMLPSSSPQRQNELETKCISWAFNQPDAQEGIMSFLEKRKPNFQPDVNQRLPSFYPWPEIPSRSRL